VFAIDRAGLVGEDGSTHHGLFDIAYLSCIPGMTLLAPRSDLMLTKIMHYTLNHHRGPIAFRYPRSEIYEELGSTLEQLAFPKAELLATGDDLTIIAVGTMVETAKKVKQLLQAINLNAAIVDPIFIKPFDVEFFCAIFAKGKPIAIIEEGTSKGGFGEALISYMVKNNIPMPRIRHYAINDTFVEHGTREELLDLVNLSPIHIFNDLKTLFT